MFFLVYLGIISTILGARTELAIQQVFPCVIFLRISPDVVPYDTAVHTVLYVVKDLIPFRHNIYWYSSTIVYYHRKKHKTMFIELYDTTT